MRILSGIQPTGEKHLGNYIGAVRQYVTYQDQGDAYYTVVDLHSLTVQPDPAELRTTTLRTVATLLAAGLDPERCTLFVQSHVADLHAELAWLLGCVATFGELNRMTQFKEKSGSQADSVTVGLFTYPVLMAADILLYDITTVPVGHDQKQHIELARNLAQRFNNRYGKTFVVPEPSIPTVGGRVMDLQDPLNKMSTTGGSEKGTVYILEGADRIVKKFKSAVTDSDNEVRVDREHKPGVTNLLEIMSIATGRSMDELAAEYQSSGYGTFKLAVAEATVEFLRPVREKFEDLWKDQGEIERILAEGAARAREHGRERVRQAREAMGCLPAARG